MPYHGKINNDIRTNSINNNNNLSNCIIDYPSSSSSYDEYGYVHHSNYQQQLLLDPNNVNKNESNNTFIDPWDFENYVYIRRTIEESMEEYSNNTTPSPAGEPISSTFYYISGDNNGNNNNNNQCRRRRRPITVDIDDYCHQSRCCYAGLDEQSFFNEKYENNSETSNDEEQCFYQTFTDTDSVTELSGRDSSKNNNDYNNYGTKSTMRFYNNKSNNNNDDEYPSYEIDNYKLQQLQLRKKLSLPKINFPEPPPPPALIQQQQQQPTSYYHNNNNNNIEYYNSLSIDDNSTLRTDNNTIKSLSASSESPASLLSEMSTYCTSSTSQSLSFTRRQIGLPAQSSSASVTSSSITNNDKDYYYCTIYECLECMQNNLSPIYNVNETIKYRSITPPPPPPHQSHSTYHIINDNNINYNNNRQYEQHQIRKSRIFSLRKHFTFSKAGLLQIDYSCNWNNLHYYIRH